MKSPVQILDKAAHISFYDNTLGLGKGMKTCLLPQHWLFCKATSLGEGKILISKLRIVELMALPNKNYLKLQHHDRHMATTQHSS